ncbi:MAG: glutamate synthase large subunit, partial [Pseudomonadota bacterium]
MNSLDRLAQVGLYRPDFEHDNCGFGLIAQIDGEASHKLVKTAINALARMTHRGAVAADGKSGDGCGLLLKKPVTFLRDKAKECGFDIGRNFCVGMVFLNPQEIRATRARVLFDKEINARGLTVNGWRTVPVNRDGCGREAQKSLPVIEQVYISAPPHMDVAEFNRNLFVARRKTEIALRDEDPEFYVCSLSANVILYKGLMMPDRLPEFYPDLNDPTLASRIAVFHQRFSTNTLPQWRLAQPFRY